MKKTALNFRSKSYEVILDNGKVSYAEKSTSPSSFTLKVESKVDNLRQAKNRVLQFLQRTPDPGMTFSD